MAAKRAGSPQERLSDTCSATELGYILDLNRRNVLDWAAKGVLVRAEGGRYLTIPSIQAYVKSLREQAAGRATSNGALSEEKAKLARTQREIADIKLAQLRGDVLTLAEVAESWSKFALAVKGAVLALPTKARSAIPHLTAHDGETLKRISRDTLSELSKQIEGIVIGGDAGKLRK
jgi:terminase small subunit / prophage DNA-packing protein